MATLSTSSSPSNSPTFHRRRKSWGRKLERCCCRTFAFFPLVFVCGLTSWAVVVEVGVSFLAHNGSWYSYFKAALGVALYALLNSSYLIAVFTSAGSPLDPRQDWSLNTSWNGGTNSRRGGYEGLPTYEDEEEGLSSEMEQGDDNMTTVTAKSSTGKQRYCKKCRCLKPDRTHHCSTCGRCVLKMDHHCPWLATCVGLRNYKSFLLFLIYTSLFCWLCFAVSATWVWAAILDDERMHEGMKIVNTILLAVLGGIIGLVLSGFTGWHIYLAVTGQTTIESLEKTRYLSPLRKSMAPQSKPERHYLGQEDANGQQEQSLLEHLKETHANALPGILRPEEGEDERSQSTTPIPPPTAQHPNESGPSSSPAKDSLQRSYASLEEQRERERYDAYLDEQDSERMPNAFDMGWKRNLLHVFGDWPWLWWLPVCNTSGDGWAWEVSPKWTKAQEEAGVRREARRREAERWNNQPPVRSFEPPRRDYRWTPGQGFVDQQTGRQSPARSTDGGSQMQMLPLDRRKAGSSDEVDSYDTSSDEDRTQRRQHGTSQQPPQSTANWNDIPEDYLAPRRLGEGRGGSRSRSRGRRKGD